MNAHGYRVGAEGLDRVTDLDPTLIDLSADTGERFGDVRNGDRAEQAAAFASLGPYVDRLGLKVALDRLSGFQIVDRAPDSRAALIDSTCLAAPLVQRMAKLRGSK